MKTFLEFFLTDSNKSMTRLLFFVDLIACIIISILGIILKRDLGSIAGLVASLLAPVSVAKFIQSKFE
jgi:hypothetical protein